MIETLEILKMKVLFLCQKDNLGSLNSVFLVLLMVKLTKKSSVFSMP